MATTEVADTFKLLPMYVLPLLKLLSWNCTKPQNVIYFTVKKDLIDKSRCMNTKLFQERRFGGIKILSFVQFTVAILHQSRYSFASAVQCYVPLCAFIFAIWTFYVAY